MRQRQYAKAICRSAELRQDNSVEVACQSGPQRCRSEPKDPFQSQETETDTKAVQRAAMAEAELEVEAEAGWGLRQRQFEAEGEAEGEALAKE